MINKYFVALFSVFSTIVIYGQINLKANNFTSVLSTPQTISVCDTSNFGFEIPIDATLKKYDKISFQLTYRKKGETVPFKELSGSSYTNLVNYPNSKSFDDYYEERKTVRAYIKASKTTSGNSIFLKKELCKDIESAEYYTMYEYQVIVKGYFETGTETYWSDYSETFKTRTLYEYSKTFNRSIPFSFVLKESDEDELVIKAAQKAAKEKRLETYNEIKIKYSITLEVPVVGLTQPRIEIFNAYERLRNELIESENFEKLDEVDHKLLSISKKYMSLNKTLKGETDTNKIMNEILNFPY